MGVFYTVVIQDAVVDALGGGTLLHDGFPFQAPARDSGKEPQIPRRFGVDGSAVGCMRAAGAVGEGLSASLRATEFYAAAVFSAEA